MLIVGAGPSGIALAIFLARAGVAARIIDSATAEGAASRAILLQSRSLEALGLGLATRLAAAGQPVLSARVVSGSKNLMQLSLGSGSGIHRYPVALEQPAVMKVLLAELRAQGASVSWETSLLDLDNPNKPVATLSDGSREEYEFVIGCDGSASKVRELSGIKFSETALVEHWIAADLEFRVAELSQDEAVMAIRNGRITAMFPKAKPGAFRIVRNSVTGAADSVNYWADALAELGIYVAPRVLWNARFEVAERLAESFRAGRIFLVGDAAHTHSPIGGQGMNLGILEANNLAWKIVAVLNGWSEKILDSYQAERMPFARQAITRAGIAFRAIRVKNPVLALLRGLFLRGGNLKPVSAFLTEALTRQHERYPAGELNLDFFDSVALADIEELPEAADIENFLKKPGAGSQFDPSSEALRSLIDHRQFTAFILDGRSDSAEGAQRVVAAREFFANQQGVRTALISPLGKQFNGSDVIVDADLSIHSQFGTSMEALYVVRPDGHIGFRSSPIDLPAAKAWWLALEKGNY